MTTKKALLLIQLGTPKSPAKKDVKNFLRVFLSDPRIIENQGFWWKVLLNLVILPTRPTKVAKAYASIWKDGTFPLFKHTEALSKDVQEYLDKDSDEYIIKHAYIIGTPTVADRLKEFHEMGIKDLRVVYLFPQFAGASTLSARDAFEKGLNDSGLTFNIEKVETFHDNPSYIQCSADKISESLKNNTTEKLLFSFHGYPLNRIFGGDQYYNHCVETTQLLAEKIEGIEAENIILCFQSKFGRDEWLEPSTEATIIRLGKEGFKKITIVSPAFIIDNLETDEELAIAAKETFIENGGEEFIKIDSLNNDKNWVEAFSEEILKKDLDKIEQLPIPEKGKVDVPKQAWKSEPLTPETKKTLKSMFIVLLLDLIGFSIIFPLFPGMLMYYGGNGGDGIPDGSYAMCIEFIQKIKEMIGGTNSDYDAVLFGGLLGSLYSLFQFIFSPIIGSLSDRFGRKPIIQYSILGIAFSYACWFFADSFALLVFSRLVGGVMSGNISTATAVVSDVTNKSNRSKGMAIIGIAFGLGFVIGPAIGAFATMVDLTQIPTIGPQLKSLGVNPYSFPALIAFILAIYNYVYLAKNFKETLSKEVRDKGKSSRSINPLKLFSVQKYPGVFLNNMIYFYFLLSFSGVEFTLTFLTFDRLKYNDINQGMMFVYIGFVLVLMQGGYVRRKASIIGEKVMIKRGLLCLIPALLILGFTHNTPLLLVGLFFLATGSAQVIPCLTSLVTQYTPENEQGRITGVFRSLGSLARACGPLFACGLYWKLGSNWFYTLGAIFLIVPILLVPKLPDPKSNE